MSPTSCFFGTQFVYNPFFLLAGALLFNEKIRQNAALLFGLRAVGILQIFFSQAVLQRTIVYSPAFLEFCLAEKIAVFLCPYNSSAEEVGGLDGFLYGAAQNFKSLFKYS